MSAFTNLDSDTLEGLQHGCTLAVPSVVSMLNHAAIIDSFDDGMISRAHRMSHHSNERRGLCNERHKHPADLRAPYQKDNLQSTNRVGSDTA